MKTLKKLFCIFCYSIWAADFVSFFYYLQQAHHYRWIKHFVKDSEFWLDHGFLTLLFIGNIILGFIAYKPLKKMWKE